MPDFGRMQATMDRMAYSTGLMASNMPHMANSTSRMAAVAERMERKSDTMLSNLEDRGSAMERTVQNYAQSFLDNDRALINSLKDISREIGDLKQAIGQSRGSALGDQSDGRINARLQAKLNRLEAQLSAISSKVDDRNRDAAAATK
ncbi:MAG: hypothetical protein RDU20_00210 [Desulfomonilaceae bacterium]|nr:hypothetical protein [Desulfomonilaceae bacterium]